MEVLGKVSAFVKARVSHPEHALAGQATNFLCNKVSFCLSAELLTSRRRGSQEVGGVDATTRMFAPVTQTKAQLRVLWKAMTLLPFSLCRCVELDILLGSGQVNFKLPRKAVLAKWLCLFSSQAVPPSDTASITLPLFHAVNRVANYPPRPPSHL